MNETDKSSKKITSEIFKMQPDAIVEMFEIDFSILQADFSELKSRFNTSIGLDGDPVYRFTSNTNGTNPIVWQGKSYQPLPVETSDFESPSDGRLPRPKLKISNPSGLLSSIVAINHDFHGCKVTRRRTFVKFLDEANFPANQSVEYSDVDEGDRKVVIRNRKAGEEGSNPFGYSDPNAHLPDDVYYIHRKLMDSRSSIEFEMTSILEVGDLQFPDRQIMADYCGFRYRDSNTCNYRGIPIMGPNGDRFAALGVYKFTVLVGGSRVNLKPSNFKNIPEWSSEAKYEKGDVVMLTQKLQPAIPAYYVCVKSPDHSNGCPAPSVSEEIWILDACTKTLSSCICHFGDQGCSAIKGLNFGGFPSTAGTKHGGK